MSYPGTLKVMKTYEADFNGDSRKWQSFVSLFLSYLLFLPSLARFRHMRNKKIVVKLGTNAMTTDDLKLDKDLIKDLVRQIAEASEHNDI